MSFYSPIFFLLFIGLVPIIIMYLLKKQHTELTISSNYLWEKALRDVEANRPWQKLKKNLLLILQLLIFSLAVFALARPFICSNAISGGHTIIVLDTSLSMQGKSKDSTRFDIGKKEGEKLIENLRPDSRVTIIAMDATPNIILNSTKDQKLARKKLEELKPSNTVDNVEETISLLKAMVKDEEDYSILVFTDKGIEADIDNLFVNYIDGEEKNIAIDNISHSIDKNDITALTRVTNYSDEDVKFDLSLYVDNKLSDVKEISLPPRESNNIYWQGIHPNVGIITVEADIDDSLKEDNIRYHVVNSNPIKKALLMTKGNVFLEKAISLNNNVELYKINEASENIEGYDLYIFDGMAPEKLPTDGNIIMINLENNELFKAPVVKFGELKALNDELFKYVNLDFSLSEARYIKDADWIEPVLLIDDNTVIGKGQKDNQKMIVLGFDFHHTDFPLKIDFPIFVQSMLDYTLNIGIQEKTNILVGEGLNLNILPKTEEISIIKPDGKKEMLSLSLALSPYTAQELGVYKIEQRIGEELPISYFASNVNTQHESMYQSMTNEEREEMAQEGKKVKGERSISNILLLLAILILAAEWVVYSRGN